VAETDKTQKISTISTTSTANKIQASILILAKQVSIKAALFRKGYRMRKQSGELKAKEERLL
jgi:hypothetical protein